MKRKCFELNEQILPIIEEIGGHMPGGFFIYRAEEPVSRSVNRDGPVSIRRIMI